MTLRRRGARLFPSVGAGRWKSALAYCRRRTELRLDGARDRVRNGIAPLGAIDLCSIVCVRKITEFDKDRGNVGRLKNRKRGRAMRTASQDIGRILESRTRFQRKA